MSDQHLSPEERHRVEVQVEHFLHLIHERYGISMAEVLELVHWARAQRDRQTKLTVAGYASLLGIIITGLVMAIVEGIRAWLRR